MERIGIFGGTFNPPHLGHIRAARQAMDSLKLDRLLLIPDRIAPHKQIPEGSPDPWQRLEMLRLAAQGIPGLEVSDLELKREGPSYTYQTVLELKQSHPQAQWFLCMGTDMFLSFPSWKNPEIILENADLAVFYRGEPKEQTATQRRLREMEPGKVHLVQNDVTPISSTDIRRLLTFQCAGEWLPGPVLDYIRAGGLYGTDRGYRRLPMEQLEPLVVSLLNPNRVAHVLGCRDTAVELARLWGEDPVDAARAGILHDITKALSAGQHRSLCRSYGMAEEELAQMNPKLFHALTGSMVAERIFGERERVVSAIRWHTTGRGRMNTLEKIIYIADYMEPNRDFPGVERLRELAFSNLDAAVLLGLEMTVEQILSRGDTVSVESAEALEDLKGKMLC